MLRSLQCRSFQPDTLRLSTNKRLQKKLLRTPIKIDSSKLLLSCIWALIDHFIKWCSWFVCFKTYNRLFNHLQGKSFNSSNHTDNSTLPEGTFGFGFIPSSPSSFHVPHISSVTDSIGRHSMRMATHIGNLGSNFTSFSVSFFPHGHSGSILGNKTYWHWDYFSTIYAHCKAFQSKSGGLPKRESNSKRFKFIMTTVAGGFVWAEADCPQTDTTSINFELTFASQDISQVSDKSWFCSFTIKQHYFQIITCIYHNQMYMLLCKPHCYKCSYKINVHIVIFFL